MSKASDKKKQARKKANAKARNVEHNRAERRALATAYAKSSLSGGNKARKMAAEGIKGNRRAFAGTKA